MLFTLNIRGLGDNTKRTGVRDFCPIQNIKIVCLQETTLDSMEDSILKYLGYYIQSWEGENAVGSCGGIFNRLEKLTSG